MHCNNAPPAATSTASLKRLLCARPSLCAGLAEAMSEALAVAETGGAANRGRPLFPPQLKLIREICHSAENHPSPIGTNTTISPSLESTPGEMKTTACEDMTPGTPATVAMLESDNEHQRSTGAGEDEIRPVAAAEKAMAPELQSVASFLAFNDKLVAWVPTLFDDAKKPVMTNVYNHVLAQHFVYTQSAAGHALVQDPEYRAWMSTAAQEWGRFCDTTGSVTADSIASMELSQSATDPDFRMNMEQYLVAPSGFQTWNQLFARHTGPAWRPVDHQDKPDTVVTSPADCVFKAWYDIDMTGRVGHWNSENDGEDAATAHRLFVPSLCTVKGKSYGTVQELLGCVTSEEFEAAEEFFGGRFFHSFLGPADYHRFRAPVRGFVRESKVITGHVFLEVQSRAADETVGEDPAFTYFDAPANTEPFRPPSSSSDSANTHAVPVADNARINDHSTMKSTSTWQFQQQRGLLLLDTAVGPVAVLPVGMASVSGVNMTATPGSVLSKGEEFGYFTFGGSDIVTVYARSPATEAIPFRPACRYIPRSLQPHTTHHGGSGSGSAGTGTPSVDRSRRLSEVSGDHGGDLPTMSQVAGPAPRKCLACTLIGVMDERAVDRSFDPYHCKGYNGQFRVPRSGLVDLDTVSDDE